MIITRTPLRISLGGGGTDLPSYYRKNGHGFLIAAAITKYVYIAVNQNFDDDLLLKYSEVQRAKSVDEVRHPLLRECLRATDISKRIEINLRAFIAGNESALPLIIKFNDGAAIPLVLTNFENNRLVLDLPKSLFEKPFITIEFAIESPKKPKDYGLGDDDRLIGIGLKSVQFLR